MLKAPINPDCALTLLIVIMQPAPVYLDRSFAFIVVAHAHRAVLSIIMRRRLLGLSALKYLKQNLPHVLPMALARCISFDRGKEDS